MVQKKERTKRPVTVVLCVDVCLLSLNRSGGDGISNVVPATWQMVSRVYYTPSMLAQNWLAVIAQGLMAAPVCCCTLCSAAASTPYAWGPARRSACGHKVDHPYLKARRFSTKTTVLFSNSVKSTSSFSAMMAMPPEPTSPTTPHKLQTKVQPVALCSDHKQRSKTQQTITNLDSPCLKGGERGKLSVRRVCVIWGSEE